MPSRDIVGVNDTTSAYPIGLEFSTPTYPSDDIVGHRFLTSIRNESNSTVVDAGITIPIKFNGAQNIEPEDKTLKFEYLAYPASNENEYATILLTPKVLTETSLQRFDYLRFNYALNRHYDEDQKAVYDSGGFLGLDNAEIRVNQIGHQDSGTTFDGLYNRLIQNTVFVKPRSLQDPLPGFNANLDNPSYQNT